MSVLLGKNKTVYIQTASTKMQVDNHVFYKKSKQQKIITTPKRRGMN